MRLPEHQSRLRQVGNHNTSGIFQHRIWLLMQRLFCGWHAVATTTAVFELHSPTFESSMSCSTTLYSLEELCLFFPPSFSVALPGLHEGLYDSAFLRRSVWWQFCLQLCPLIKRFVKEVKRELQVTPTFQPQAGAHALMSDHCWQHGWTSGFFFLRAGVSIKDIRVRSWWATLNLLKMFYLLQISIKKSG